MTAYKHPKLWRIAYVYNPYFEDKFMCEELSTTTTYNETALEALWFELLQEELAEKDWIDKAFDRYYYNDTEYTGPDRESYNKKVFRLAIEEYMPKPPPL